MVPDTNTVGRGTDRVRYDNYLFTTNNHEVNYLSFGVKVGVEGEKKEVRGNEESREGSGQRQRLRDGIWGFKVEGVEGFSKRSRPDEEGYDCRPCLRALFGQYKEGLTVTGPP